MSKPEFTRTFGSLADFAEQFGEAYVQANDPSRAVERIHQAPATTTVTTQPTQEEVDRIVRKQVAKMKRKMRGGNVNRAVSKSKSKRVRKVL